MIDSMLLGSILTYIKVAYIISKSEIEKLQKSLEMGLRKPPTKMLYFLTGSITVEFLIQRRRLVYLQHSLKPDKDSLLKTFKLQTRKSKDWASQVIKNLEKIEIILTFEEISNMPEE